MRERLVELFGEDRVITDPDRLHDYHDDCTEGDGQDPAAVVFVETTEDVVALMGAAHELNSSITPRVANTNVGGLAIAAEGGIIADMTRMNRIVEVNDEDMYAIIEPGVTQIQLKEQLAKEDIPLCLGYSLAPPHVSILANCILDGLTNRSLKYGSMSQWVSGLEVVLADGTVLKTGAWAIEGMPPFGRPPLPDLTGMFTAFQGTTGIVTKVVFQLWPQHPLEQRLFILGYDTEGVYNAMQRLCRMEICEDIGGLSWPSGKMMMGVSHPNPVPDPDEPTFYLYIDLTAEIQEEMDYKVKLVNQALEEQRAAGHRFESPLDINTLIKVNPAMDKFASFPTDLEFLTSHAGGGLTWMGTYGMLSRFAKTADACSETMVKYGFPPSIVSRPMRGGHFGVLRFVITFDKKDADEVQRVRELMMALLEQVTDAGFAMYKTPHWALQWLKPRIDPATLELVRKTKKLLDPEGILNPDRMRV